MSAGTLTRANRSASTGPPHERGGKAHDRWGTPCKYGLQRGRRMNAAESSMSAARREADSRLQRGRRMNAAESHRRPFLVSFALLQRGRRMNAAERRVRTAPDSRRSQASTGPPHERGGKCEVDRLLVRARHASTGPPHERGGKRSSPVRRCAPSTLQRGRRMNAAESSATSHTEPNVQALQRGRRMNAAERVTPTTNATRAKRLQRGRRMNAAESRLAERKRIHAIRV